MMPGDNVLTEPVVRRAEVFTGAGRRRARSAEKARIVAESYATSAGEVADRYGVGEDPALHEAVDFDPTTKVYSLGHGAIELARVALDPGDAFDVAKVVWLE